MALEMCKDMDRSYEKAHQAVERIDYINVVQQGRDVEEHDIQVLRYINIDRIKKPTDYWVRMAQEHHREIQEKWSKTISTLTPITTLTKKLGVLKILATRAIRISDEAHLEQEKDHLSVVFKNIGYKHKDITNAINKALEKNNKNPNPLEDQNPNRKAYLAYIQGFTNKIANILSKKEIKTSFKPHETIKQNMRSVKDNPDPHKGKWIYKIECSCEECYIGETGRSFQIRIEEHGADIKNERIRTSALA